MIPCSHPQTLTLVLNFLLRLISYSAKYKMIFAQVGILTMMINALKVYAKELKEGDQQTGMCMCTRQDSLPIVIRTIDISSYIGVDFMQ